MPTTSELSSRLAELEAAGLLRVADDGETRRRWEAEHGHAGVDASSNDYLGLGRLTVSRETSAQGSGRVSSHENPSSFSVSRETLPRAFSEGSRERLGSGASRLIHGTQPVHVEVEKLVAEWVGAEAALLFSSGYAANVGALSALLGPGEVVLSDALNHASIIDGIRLSRARPVVLPHLDLAALERGLREEKPTWVVLESYYSMDGDSPDLGRVRELCDAFGANLYVDEAHSIGLFGPRGAGLCAKAGIRADALVAAFGKAVGSHGAAVVGSAQLRSWLYNKARSFVFSTAPSPAYVRELRDQIERAQGAEDARNRTWNYSSELRARLVSLGVPIGAGTLGPIVSVIVGSERRALALAQSLAGSGILAQAIRPPTVPEGQARVRLTVGAHLRPGDPARIAEALGNGLAALGNVG